MGTGRLPEPSPESSWGPCQGTSEEGAPPRAGTHPVFSPVCIRARGSCSEPRLSAVGGRGGEEWGRPSGSLLSRSWSTSLWGEHTVRGCGRHSLRWEVSAWDAHPRHARGSGRAVFPPAQPRLLGEVVVALGLLPQVVVLHTFAHGPRAYLRASPAVTVAPRPHCPHLPAPSASRTAGTGPGPCRSWTKQDSACSPHRLLPTRPRGASPLLKQDGAPSHHLTGVEPEPHYSPQIHTSSAHLPRSRPLAPKGSGIHLVAQQRGEQRCWCRHRDGSLLFPPSAKGHEQQGRAAHECKPDTTKAHATGS